MSGRMNKRVVQLSLVLVLGALSLGSAQAASPSAPGEFNNNELTLLEHRFFSHPYGHDPVEKRLERLECLVFGSTREGKNNDRLQRLIKAVAARSAQPLAQEKSSSVAATEQTPSKSLNNSKQYPILNTLEWKALKKTYPGESLDQRLDRMESKMFGQPAQTMAYADRVERLKKILGIGAEANISDGITAQGPMPKARPHGEDDGFSGGAPGMTIPLESFVQPPALNFDIDPFGGTTFGGALLPLQQLRALNKQMADMQKLGAELGPGKWVLDPSTKEWVEQNTGKRVNPLGRIVTPGGKGPLPQNKSRISVPLLPAPNSSAGQSRDIPGYADPNSI